MEGNLAVDMDKWFQSQVVEVEVSSEVQQPAFFDQYDEKGEQFGYPSSQKITNIVDARNFEYESKSNLLLPKKKRRKSGLSDLETDFEFNSESMKFKCNRCDRYFSQKSSILYHLRNICGVDPKYPCSICSFQTKSHANLKVHLAKHHGLVQQSTKNHSRKSFNDPGKATKGNHSNLSTVPLNQQSIYKSNANYTAMKVDKTHKYLQPEFDSGLTEQDSLSYSEEESSSQSESEEEQEETQGIEEEESYTNDMKAEEQLKHITASLEQKTNSENKILTIPAGDNSLEPKKLIRFVDFDCAFNSYPDTGQRKVSNVTLARRHHQNLKRQQQFSDVDVQFIKLETPRSDSLMKHFPVKPRKSKSEEKEKKPRKKRNSDLPDVDDEFEFDEELQRFKCKRCGKLLKSRISILNHLRNICGVEPKHACPLCSFKTKYSVCLKVHIAKLHSGTEEMAEPNENAQFSKDITRKCKPSKKKGTKKKSQGRQDDSDSSNSGNTPMSCDEDSYDSEFEQDRKKKPQKMELLKENEFVYDVKEDNFKCKSCNQIFKNKGVVALHRHVACSNFSTVE